MQRRLRIILAVTAAVGALALGVGTAFADTPDVNGDTPSVGTADSPEMPAAPSAPSADSADPAVRGASGSATTMGDDATRMSDDASDMGTSTGESAPGSGSSNDDAADPSALTGGVQK